MHSIEVLSEAQVRLGWARCQPRRVADASQISLLPSACVHWPTSVLIIDFVMPTCLADTTMGLLAKSVCGGWYALTLHGKAQLMLQHMHQTQHQLIAAGLRRQETFS